MPTPIYYHFQQHFKASAPKAFEWCTTYTPKDHELMGETGVSRKVENITDRTIILIDTFNPGTDNQIEKKKLVQIYPETLSWISTHLNGPARYSQFTYMITAGAVDNSHLDFTGLLLDYNNEKMSEADAAKQAGTACRKDAESWVLLAKAMEQELS